MDFVEYEKYEGVDTYMYLLGYLYSFRCAQHVDGKILKPEDMKD